MPTEPIGRRFWNSCGASKYALMIWAWFSERRCSAKIEPCASRGATKRCSFFCPMQRQTLSSASSCVRTNFFEIDVLERCRRYVPQGASIIDAGANIGNHAVYFAKLCGAKKIFAFEPLRQTFKILERNIQLNAPEKIQCFNFALGAAEGRAELRKYALDNLGATVLGVSDAGQYPVLPLDSFEFDALDVIKIDVEGAEVSVLEGARQTLAKFRPVIVTEILPETNQVSDEKLKALNYRRVEALSDRDFVYCHNG